MLSHLLYLAPVPYFTPTPRTRPLSHTYSSPSCSPPPPTRVESVSAYLHDGATFAWQQQHAGRHKALTAATAALTTPTATTDATDATDALTPTASSWDLFSALKGDGGGGGGGTAAGKRVVPLLERFHVDVALQVATLFPPLNPPDLSRPAVVTTLTLVLRGDFADKLYPSSDRRQLDPDPWILIIPPTCPPTTRQVATSVHPRLPQTRVKLDASPICLYLSPAR